MAHYQSEPIKYFLKEMTIMQFTASKAEKQNITSRAHEDVQPTQ